LSSVVRLVLLLVGTSSPRSSLIANANPSATIFPTVSALIGALSHVVIADGTREIVSALKRTWYWIPVPPDFHGAVRHYRLSDLAQILIPPLLLQGRREQEDKNSKEMKTDGGPPSKRALTSRTACLVDSIMVLPSSRPELLFKTNHLRRKWKLHRANHNFLHLPINLHRKMPIMTRTITLLTLQLQTLGNPPLPIQKRSTSRVLLSPLQIEDLIPYTVIISMTILVNTSMAALKMMAFGKIICDG